jgi:hypothetical protein
MPCSALPRRSAAGPRPRARYVRATGRPGGQRLHRSPARSDDARSVHPRHCANSARQSSARCRRQNPERRERPAQSRRRRDVLVAYPRTYAAWLCKSACMSGLTPILHRLRRGGQTQWRGVTLLSCRPGPDRSRGTTDGLIALLRRRARVCAATVAARRIAHERERRLG